MLVSQNIFELKVLYLFCKKYLNTKSIFAPAWSLRVNLLSTISVVYGYALMTLLFSTVDRVRSFFFVRSHTFYF